MSIRNLLTIGVAFAIATTAAHAAEERKNMDTKEKHTLGVVLFDGFELLDIMGPLEMFGNVGNRLEIIMVAEHAGPVASAQKIQTVADYGFDDCPDLDILLVPGGRGTVLFVKNEASMKWLKQRAAKADIVTSVCNGSAILADAGLLDGYKATTNKMAFDMVSKKGNGVEWVRTARWVDDGDRVTSSGVSAGMDMALHLIARLFGEKTAERIATGTEYEWHRDPSWDPFAKLWEK